jgi:hypothetical protein
MDINGNKILQVRFNLSRGFSVQTNGNLPMTHRDGVGFWTATELQDYVLRYGTKRQIKLVCGPLIAGGLL